MSFLKLESECTDAGAASPNDLDTSSTDTKTTHDVNFYKEVIKRLQEELSKIKSENERLRETVFAYSIKLPQVSRKLHNLAASLEAGAYKLIKRKKHRSNDEGLNSSEESSLNGGDADCELQDGASEDEASQRARTTRSEEAHQSVQNFVEVICEEENSVENGSSTNGDVNNAAASIGNPKLTGKEKKDSSVENNAKSSASNTRPMSSRNRKLRNLKLIPPSKVKHIREVIIKKNTREKKPNIQDTNQDQEQILKLSASVKENKSVSKAVSGEQVSEVVGKIKLEETLQDSSVVENNTHENPKRSKVQRQLQESVISTVSNQGATGTKENASNDTADLRRRGRRRAYDCEVCGRTFARSSNLAHHVMRHRNERPHQCEICDRAFVQKANLKVHLRSHTGERPFSCTECGRAFAQKNNALRHLRAHARQRQLQEQKLVCPVCGKSFGRWPSYETHMRRSHSNMQSNTVGPITPCIVDGMVNDSHPTDAPPCVTEIDGGGPHPGSNIPHNVGNVMTNSQLPLEPSNLENVHPTVSLTNVHANDSINNGHIPPGHHPQNEHLLVGDHVNITHQLSGAHSCADTTC